jgi:hypothetical protein
VDDRREGHRSRPEWTALEKWARVQVQGFVQEVSNAEVTELLGTEKAEPRTPRALCASAALPARPRAGQPPPPRAYQPMCRP